MNIMAMNRRGFLKATGTAAAGLVVGFHLPSGTVGAAELAGRATLNAFVHIKPDGRVVFLSPFSEMGQGVLTSQAMLIAEELEVALDAIEVEMSPATEAYNISILGLQITGASQTLRSGFVPLRNAAATAREMLKAAAAATWQVPVGECRAENGRIIHSSGKSLGYGELAEAAAALEAPADVALKPQAEWKVAGRSQPRNDIVAKTNGSAVFGIDLEMDGMLVATLVQTPTLGGKLKAVDEAPALAMPGVRQVLKLENAVAVIADTYWQALSAVRALEPEWDQGPNAGVTTDQLRDRLAAELGKEGAVAKNDGDVAGAMAQAAKTVSRDYEVPFVAHLTLEPMNATARVTDDRIDIWAPTQVQGVAKLVLPQIFKLPPEAVHIHTTLLGGGFGRRLDLDFIIQAAFISKFSGGQIVKLVWSREEDTTHDVYGPMGLGRLTAAIDSQGRITAIDAKVASPSISVRTAPQVIKAGVDPNMVEGLVEQPYRFANHRVANIFHDVGFGVGYWRSVGHRMNGFFFETLLNEVAQELGRDSFDLRMELCQSNDKATALIAHLRQDSQWDSPAPAGRFRGVAVHESFGTLVGHVAEISVAGKAVRVHKVSTVVDAGPAINPDNIRSQIESAVIDGLNTAFHGEITLTDGKVDQEQIHDFTWIGIGQVPEISVAIRQTGDIGGIGEPGLPPVAPALTDAIFRATGERVRALPLAKAGYSLA